MYKIILLFVFCSILFGQTDKKIQREYQYTPSGILEAFTEFRYDSLGNLISRYYSKAETKTLYKYRYDGKKNLVYREYFHDGKISRFFKYDYDTTGKILKEYEYFPDGSLLAYSKYFYDEKDKLIKEVSYTSEEWFVFLHTKGKSTLNNDDFNSEKIKGLHEKAKDEKIRLSSYIIHEYDLSGRANKNIFYNLDNKINYFTINTYDNNLLVRTDYYDEKDKLFQYCISSY